jgi:hypothetical protein
MHRVRVRLLLPLDDCLDTAGCGGGIVVGDQRQIQVEILVSGFEFDRVH